MSGPVSSLHVAEGDTILQINAESYHPAYLQAKDQKQRLLIPRDALLIRDDRALVFVHEGGQAKWRYVRTGLENDDLAHDAKVVAVQR